MEKIKLSFSAKADNISIARLTTSAVCMKLNFGIDELEDMKLCVGEACNIILENPNEIEKIKIKFEIEKDLEISVKADYEEIIDMNTKSDTKSEDSAPNYALMIIETLMDNVKLEEDKDGISIKMKKEMR